jgi:hypothetical protein
MRLATGVSVLLLIQSCSEAESSGNNGLCSQAPISQRADGFYEISGIRNQYEVHGLLFSPQAGRVEVGDRVKIVWRATGNGELTLNAVDPSGTSVAPTEGPIAHGQSSFDEPGEEWGSEFVFRTEGCWTLVVQRGYESINLQLPVSDA